MANTNMMMILLLAICICVALGLAGYATYTVVQEQKDIKALKAKDVETDQKIVSLKGTGTTVVPGTVSEIGRVSVPGVKIKAATPPSVRADVVPVTFTKTYTKPPTVHLSVLSIDANTPPNIRYNLKATEITTTGFNLSVGVWWDTVVTSVEVEYLVIVSP
jgi:hypothetical protein